MLADEPGHVPEVGATRTADDALVVTWRAAVADAPNASGPSARPFVVVGFTDYAGPVRFERVE